MTLAYYPVILVVVLAVIWLLRPGKPATNGPLTDPMLRAVLDALLYRGVAETRLVITGCDITKRIELEKYIRDDKVGIELYVPTENWAPPRAAEIQQALDGLCERQRTEPLGGRMAGKVIVDVGKDLERARTLVRLVMEGGYGLVLATEGSAEFSGNLLPVEVPALTHVQRSNEP